MGRRPTKTILKKEKIEKPKEEDKESPNLQTKIKVNSDAKQNEKKEFKFPAARIKRMMQNDDRIGKISTYAPVVLGKATELFVVEFIAEASKYVEMKRKLEVNDFKKAIENNKKFGFLKIEENKEIEE